MSNPLLYKSDFAAYAEIRAEHIIPAVQQVVAEAKTKLEEILATSTLSFDSVHRAFIELEENIDKVWTPVENMLSLVGTKDVRDAAEEARNIVVEFYNDYSLDERVYKLIKAYDASPDAKTLQGEYLRYHQDTLKDLKLSGAELEGEAKEEFKKLNLELAQLTQKFSDNVTDSKFELLITNKTDLSGLPADFVEAAAHAASEKGQQGWLINLDYPSYGPFMKFSDRGDLRKQLYIEYLSKASPNKHPSHNNNELITKIRVAKARKSRLLDFNNYAEYSLCTKMAEKPSRVLEFLERIAVAVKPLAQREYSELVKFQQELGYTNTENNPNLVYPWDRDYLAEKLRKAKYDLDSNLVKQYFELNTTLQGMYSIAERLFGLRIEPVIARNAAGMTKQSTAQMDCFVASAPRNDIQVWHEDVEVYQVLDAVSSEVIGYFYTDFFPREIKRQGAWMMPLVQGEKTTGDRHALEPAASEARLGLAMTDRYRQPQCVLSCNLTKPIGDKPSLLTHLEVTTLFHEFGHGLHHLLTRAELSPMAGTNVEWDFVELPSQLMENFCWETDSLALFAKHHSSGEPIPKDLLAKIIAARQFNEGIACVRQLEFALFDLAVYMDENPESDVNAIYAGIVKKHGVFPVIPETNFPASFSHIFAGGYAAGYYSYKWAEALEADAFSRFKHEGILSTKVGREYRASILERGDTEPPMELFKKFMGREPNENALLERMGVKT